MQSGLLKKFLSFSYGSWIGLVIGLVTTMITTRILSPDHFGKASMFTLVINLAMMLILLGSDQSFVRFYYEEEENKRGKLLYNSLFYPIILGLIVSILLVLFRDEVSEYLFDEKDGKLIYLLAFAIILQVLNRFAVLVVRMQQKGHLFSIVEISSKILNLFFILVFYYLLGSNYRILVLSTFCFTLTITIWVILKEKNFWNLDSLKIKSTIHSKRDIAKFGLPLVLTSLITWLFTSFDKIAIKEFSTYEELGLYSAAFRIVSLVAVVQTTFSTFWTPVAFEHYEKNPENKRFYCKISSYISLAMFFVAIASILLKDLIVFLLGNNYSESSKIMPFLVFMPLMYTVSEVTVIGINFYKKTKWHVVIAAISCLVNIIGNILLVPSHGALGASISTAGSYVVFFFLRTTIAKKYYNFDFNNMRFYLMTTMIIVYAFYSISVISILKNVFAGIISLFILSIVYKNELAIGFQKVKAIIRTHKNV